MQKRLAIGLAAVLVLSTVSALLAPAASAASTGFSDTTTLNEWTTSSLADLALAVGPGGKTLAAWTDYPAAASNYVVVYRFYTPGAGWGSSSMLWDVWGNSFNLPAVAASANGNFLLAHLNTGAGNPTVLTYIYNATAEQMYTMGTPVTLSTVGIGLPHVAMDGQGNGVATWLESDGTEWNLTAARYTEGVGWGAPHVLDTQTTTPALPRVVMDLNGDVIVGWQQTVAGHVNAYAVVSEAGGDVWSAPSSLESTDFDVSSMRVAIDGAGNGWGAWVQSNGTSTNVYAMRWNFLSGWLGPFQVSGPLGFSGALSIDANGGRAVAAFTHYNNVELQVHASIFDGLNWSTPTNLSAEWPEGGGSGPVAAIDNTGMAVVAWTRYETTHPVKIYAARGDTAHGWSPAVQVDPPTGDSRYGLVMAMNENGQGVAAWGSASGFNSNFFARPFGLADATPPSLSLSAPAPGAVVNASIVLVCGNTDPGVSMVEVHGYFAAPDGTGEFCLWIPLHPGNNTLQVFATDAAGNQATTQVTVAFDDPLPGLQEDLAAAQAAAGEARAHGDAAAAALQAELDLTQTELSAARHQLNITNDTVGTLERNQATQSAALQASTAAASSAASMAALMGLVALIVGVVGALMALLAMRKGASAPASPAPSTPPSASTPPATPPAEPPKT